MVLHDGLQLFTQGWGCFTAGGTVNAIQARHGAFNIGIGRRRVFDPFAQGFFNEQARGAAEYNKV